MILFILIALMLDVLLFVDHEAHRIHERSGLFVHRMPDPFGKVEGWPSSLSDTKRRGSMVVRMTKEQATRHLAVTQDGQIIGAISLSSILRYYSGVVSQHATH